MIEFAYMPSAKWLIAIGALIAIAVFASYSSGRGRAKGWTRGTLGALRWLALAAVVVCLLGPEWVEPVKKQEKARLAVLLDTSRSMGIKDLPGERIAAAKEWLQGEFGPAVPENIALNYYTFSDSLEPLSKVQEAQAEGNASGLAGALEALLPLPGAEPLTGVVLCSDGIENLRHDTANVARSYRRKGIPIHTLTIGTTNDMRDVIVNNVQVRRAVPNQAPTKVTVTLRTAGYAKQSVPVQIFHENELMASTNVELTGAAQKVEIDFTPRQKGYQIYEVRVPEQADEWLTTNNRRLFGIDVIDPTIRVIYMEGTPQQPNSPIPEWKYLKSALESDPNIKVTTLYREFGATGKRLNVVDTDPETGEKIYPVEHPSKGFPRTMSSLLEFDVVIHSDIKTESFSAAQLRYMQRLVEEFGGGFVMIGGNSAFGKGGYHRTALDRVIPLAMQQESDSQARPFKMRMTPAAWLHPVIAFGSTREESELIWTKKFPLLYGCNVVDRAKPGATILGFDPSTPTPRGARLLLAVQNVGHGRSMAFTSDTTRTWGKDFETLWGEKIDPALPLTEENCDSRYYRQFWVNAIRWLAAGRTRTNSAVNLELAQSYCLPNEKVTASVKVRDKNMRETSTADVTLLAITNGVTNVVGKATFNGETRSYLSDFTLPTRGDFKLTAVASIRGAEVGTDCQLLVCQDTDQEIAELRAQPGHMADIARISGGKVLSLSGNETASIASVFYNAPPVTVDYQRTPLWDKSWWLGAIIGLLSVEWALRRLNGMA